MNNSTEDQSVSIEASTAAPKSEKRANVAKAPRQAKAAKKKKTEIKFFITAAALTATVGGWAGMATSLATTASAPAPIAEQVAPSMQEIAPSQQQALRPVSIPNASAPTEQILRQATRPEPAARTRGSN